jgi:hypothetical protein
MSFVYAHPPRSNENQATAAACCYRTGVASHQTKTLSPRRRRRCHCHVNNASVSLFHKNQQTTKVGPVDYLYRPIPNEVLVVFGPTTTIGSFITQSTTLVQGLAGDFIYFAEQTGARRRLVCDFVVLGGAKVAPRNRDARGWTGSLFGPQSQLLDPLAIRHIVEYAHHELFVRRGVTCRGRSA